jgi:hypothetical protein
MLGKNENGPPLSNGELLKCKKLAEDLGITAFEAFEIMNKGKELFDFPPERFKELTNLEMLKACLMVQIKKQ